MKFLKWLFHCLSSDQSDLRVDAVDLAAYDLMVFLHRSISPMDADGQENEWPVSIVVDTPEAADQMIGLLMNLERALNAKCLHPKSDVDAMNGLDDTSPL